MIAHVVLYRFPAAMSAPDRDAFLNDLTSATVASKIPTRFTAGQHCPLPEADAVAPESMFSVAARWEFTDLSSMSRFSEHPAVSSLIDQWVERAGIDVAFANTNDEIEVQV